MGKPVKDNLIGIGMTGKVPTIQANVFMKKEEVQAVAKALVQLNRNISNKQVIEFMQNTLKILPKELKLKGKAGWDSDLPSMAKPHTSTRETVENRGICLDLPTGAAFLECPRCNKVESITEKGFQTKDLDKTRRCFHCKKYSAVKNWECGCGTKWHLCSVHGHGRTECNSHQQIGDTRSQPTHPTGKLKGNHSSNSYKEHTFEDLLDGDVKRAAKRKYSPSGAEQMLTLSSDRRPPALYNIRLGPILTKRFRGAGLMPITM
jgi:hypothetical protein